jgi:hypothetical protein
MKPAWMRQAAALPLRQLHLAGAGLLLIACAALWFYGLRVPLAQLRTVRAEHARLAQGGSDPRLLEAQLALLASDSSVLARALGNAPAGPTAPLLVQLVGDVGRLAAQHRVALQGTSPAPELKALGFEQFGIEVDAAGQYASLLAWIDAIENSRPNLAIDRVAMQAGKTPGEVQVKLNIAVFRPMGSMP